MKKVFAILLAVLMLLPIIASCGEEREEPDPVPSSSSQPSTTNPSTTTPSQGGTTSSSDNGGNPDVPDVPDDPNKQETPPETITKWSGKTLNILGTVWVGTEPGSPWSQVELCVKPLTDPGAYKDDTNFGLTINGAVLDREAFIKKEYGVSLNWINARTNQISTLITNAIMSGSKETRYHIAMPRMMEAQTIVSNGSIFDVSKSKYIDLDKSYYNQAARESYTVNGITLFMSGDFSFLDEQTSFLIFYNEAMADGISAFPDVYKMVREGKWTIDQMTNIAKLVKKNSGDPAWTDDDTYGFGTTNLGKFYQYSGIQQIQVIDGEYRISLNDPKVGTLIDKILGISGSDWARVNWTGGFEGMEAAFFDSRLLFYNEVIQKTDHIKEQTDEFKVGILPAPKLNEAQETYFTPCSYQSVVMCIPKTTTDREFSEYFFEILSYTGQKYVMRAYLTNLRTKLNPETATESMEIIENYIFANLCYDQGYMWGWDGLLSSVQTDSYKDGVNKFTEVFTDASEEKALIVTDWNRAWLDYVDYVE
ncbi:MAG: hypothetical protein J6D23_04320 [Clostridia bacterium]|nr:hypothetical protein [Clostridia bacterium]